MPKKNLTTGLATEWKRVEIISNVTNSENYVEFGDIGFIQFKVRNIMIEKANKAGTFTPAPEDIQAEINSAKQEALTAANNVQTNVK